MNAKYHFIHHACFMVEKNNTSIIFDPFLDGNPEGLGPQDIKVDYVFVTHGHGDHLGSALEIAKNCDATIISTAEICYMAEAEGCKTHAMHLGGTHLFPFGKVRIAPAFHGSGITGGHACGFIVDFFDTRFYFAGDTALYSDMQLLPQLEPFTYAILPIGDNFTMGPQDAVLAVKFLQPQYVIPVHYNTWPVIAQDPHAFKAEVEAQTPAKVIVVDPGQTIELD